MEQPLTKLFYKFLNNTSHGNINHRVGYYQYSNSHQQHAKKEGLLTCYRKV